MTLPTLLQSGTLSQPKIPNPDKKSTVQLLMDVYFRTRVGTPAEHPEDRILVLKSGTGSAKSTALPTTIYRELFQSMGERNIAITQPRVLTAIEITNTIVSSGHYPEMVLGETIGYQTGQFMRRPIRGVIFLSQGTLDAQLRVMTDDEIISRYSVILIDEAHDRSIQTDMSLMLLKHLIHRNLHRADCPFLIVMSATFNTEKYAKYLIGGRTPDTHTWVVEGHSHPVEEVFLEQTAGNVIQCVIDTVVTTHKSRYRNENQEFRDMLVFAHSAYAIDKISEGLERQNNPDLPYKVMPLSSAQVSSGNTGDIYKPLDKQRVTIRGRTVTPVRRVIVSTNVAETGLTIPTLGYSIDTGLVKSAEFNPIYGCKVLVDKPVTRGMAKQRRGRAGREAPGVWLPIYTRETYDAMTEDQFPQIITEDFSGTLLSIIYKFYEPNIPDFTDWTKSHTVDDVKKLFSVSEIDMLDTPPTDMIWYALNKLYMLGFIDRDVMLTRLGKIANYMSRVSVEGRRALLATYEVGVPAQEMATIVATIETGGLGSITDRREYKSRRMDDNIEPVHIYNDFLKKLATTDDLDKLQKWCVKRGINYSGFMSMLGTRDDIIYALADAGVNPYTKNEDEFDDCGTHVGKLLQCLHAGYRLNVVENVGGEWRCEQTGLSPVVAPVLNIPVSKYTRVMSTTLIIKATRGEYKYQASGISLVDGEIIHDPAFGLW